MTILVSEKNKPIFRLSKVVEPSQLEEGRRLRPDDEEYEDIGAVVDTTESDWKPSEHVVIDTRPDNGV